jgi:HSP20 family protein
MVTFSQLRNGVEQAVDNLAQGWRALRDRTAQALTRFTPRTGSAGGGVDQVAHMASRWGLLVADVMEGDDEVVVKLEVPGMRAQDLDIQVVDDMLVVRGEKYAEQEDSHGRYHILECAYGGFERAIALPAQVDEAGARAKYTHGVLRVVLPKVIRAQRQRIEIGVR